jgi:4-nitrophenyl phosphatase
METLPVAAIILAAGASTRMGRPKQLLPVGGRPMVRRVAEAVCAAGPAQVIVVVGAYAEAVRQALAGLPLQVIANEQWAAGMSTSLHAGLRAVEPGVRAALIVLADQPGLTPDLIRALVDRYQATGIPVVAPFFRGRRGSPVLFDRALFGELLAVEGDEGGRQVLARYEQRLARVEVAAAELLRDVDTRQEYEQLITFPDEEKRNSIMADELLRSLKHLIIDMDGVLYRGKEAIPGTNAFLSFLREQGIGFLLMTNNSTRTPQQYAERLAAMDVAVRPDEIFTSAEATARYLAGIAPTGARVFVIGMDGLFSALRDAGFSIVEDRADYVVAGMDFTVCYERLAQATLQIRAGAPFIGTNPDLTFPSERGIVPGAGALLALLEAGSGVRPRIIGKPDTAMVEQALSRLSARRESTGMLGDRLETDILAGRRAGLPTLLVLTGVTDRAMLASSDMQPDLVYDDVSHLHRVWKQVLETNH